MGNDSKALAEVPAAWSMMASALKRAMELAWDAWSGTRDKAMEQMRQGYPGPQLTSAGNEDNFLVPVIMFLGGRR